MKPEALQVVSDNNYLQAAYALLAAAKKEILLSSYKFQISHVPRARRFTRLINALTNAMSRGVRFKMILHYTPNMKGVPRENLPAMEFLKKKGADIRYITMSRIVHAKILIVDSNAMMIGSHNWSISSMTANAELSLLVKDSLSIQQTQNYFLNLWEKATPFK